MDVFNLIRNVINKLMNTFYRYRKKNALVHRNPTGAGCHYPWAKNTNKYCY